MKHKTSNRILGIVWFVTLAFVATVLLLVPPATKTTSEPEPDETSTSYEDSQLEATRPVEQVERQDLQVIEREASLALFAEGLSRFSETETQNTDDFEQVKAQEENSIPVAADAIPVSSDTMQAAGLEPASESISETLVFEETGHLLYIDASTLNLRAGPSTHYAVVDQLRFGDTVDSIAESEDWVRVRHENELGYLSREFTSRNMVFRAVEETRYVDVGSLNLRADPSTDAEILSKMSRNTRLTRTGVGSEWSRVQTADGTEGFVASDYLTERVFVEVGTTHDARRSYGPIEQANFDLFKKIVALESRPQFGYDGYLAVASVILNRVDSSRFPNTVRGVVSQRGQFCTYTSSRTPHYSDAVDRAVRDALAGKRNLPDYVLFFANPDGYARNVAQGGVFARLEVHSFAYNHHWSYYASDRR